jgi:L-lactate permease
MTPLLTEGHWLNPIWTLRFFAFVPTVLLALAMTVFRSGTWHGMCLGAALGLLVGFSAFSTSIKAVVLKDAPQPSDVKPYTIR